MILEFSSPVHHGTGEGIAHLVDRAFRRDSDGVPHLSGAALKGKLRYGALRWMRTTGEGNPECRPEDGRSCREEPCLFCQVFGSPRGAGRAVFSDCYPREADWFRDYSASISSPVLQAGGEVRTTTAINRRTRTVQPQHLFSTETIPAHVVFEGRISGRLNDAQQQLIRQGACLLNHFGADSARGLGFCRFNLVETEMGAAE
ncbi:MAG: hypothetical protein K2X03_01485 [Bryobacteraceae bacterium]|nr:hypothetical protein [Bryobacteraceae bacterium]